MEGFGAQYLEVAKLQKCLVSKRQCVHQNSPCSRDSVVINNGRIICDTSVELC